jgi:hypothetical protein
MEVQETIATDSEDEGAAERSVLLTLARTTAKMGG